MPTASNLNPPKRYLNEHISPRVALQLRHHGFDVTSSQEEQMLSSSDEEQFTFAVQAHRAVLTYNVADFMNLHFEYMGRQETHWGLIFSTQQPLGILLKRLLRLLHSVTADDLKNQIFWLNDFK